MRAGDVKVGDTLPDGRTVVRVNRTDRALYIFVRDGDRTKRLRYQPETIMPTVDQRYPSRFTGGHPWARYRAASTHGSRRSDGI
jgi:hypothetical protein